MASTHGCPAGGSRNRSLWACDLARGYLPARPLTADLVLAAAV